MATHGSKKHNDAPPQDTNVGVLPALANASPSALTEGNQIGLSTDLYGHLRVADYDFSLDTVLDNSGPSNQPLYQGWAVAGSSDGSGFSVWKVKKYFYDANNVLMGWRWANGSPAFNVDWTLRASQTYASL